MKIDFATPFVAAWTLWRRDHPLLLPVAGLCLFLPQYALLLLVPAMPRLADGDSTPDAMLAWSKAVSAWAGEHGGWYIAVPMISLFGVVLITTLYLDRDRPTLGAAMAKALALVLRYLLATILIGIPVGALMLAAIPAPVLAYILPLPMCYILARAMLVAPVLVAERPVGAVAAIGRSITLTKGQGFVVTGIYAAAAFIGPVIGSAILSLSDTAAVNPVLTAILAATASLATAASQLAVALVQVVLYGRLASRGT